MNLRWWTLLGTLFLGLLGTRDGWANNGSPPKEYGRQVHLKLRLHDVHDVAMTRGPDGAYRYVLTDDQGVNHLTAEQFADRLYRDHTSRTFLQLLFNISGPIGVTWVALGFLGQAMFTGRMLIQWLVSEKRRRSVVPVAFWWLSLLGGMMLLTYFTWRKDIVGVVGQSTGLLVYGRNLILIRRQRGADERRALRP